MINIKTGIDALPPEAFPVCLLYLRLRHFCSHHAADFPLRHHRQFFRKDKRRKYGHPALYALGRSVVSADLYMA